MSISVKDGGSHIKHNYYAPEDYFNQDERRGVILDPDDRVARVGEDFIIAMHHGFENMFGGSAGSLAMYNVGKNWGEKHFDEFSKKMRQEYGGGSKDVQSMNMQFVFETWWWPLTLGGFGGWSIELQNRNKGMTVIDIKNSVVAQSLEKGPKPVCHLYAGLFAGALSVYDKDERASIELECYTMGANSCKFVVGSDDKMNAAEFWKEEGATASDIMSQLK